MNFISQVRANQRFTHKYSKHVFTVKVFTGDSETDDPEFSEYSRLSASIEDFMNMDSSCHMIKVDIKNTRNPILSNLFSIARCEALKLRVNDEECNMGVLRITGRNWKFPMHYDSGHQLVVHLQGEKTWFWRLDGETRSVLARPGDVYFIPAGVWHSTRNESTSVMLNYGWICQHTNALTKAFMKDYPKRMDVLMKLGD
jgi:mannose-6-phosphate isomerase-like protein (cupin superfamily)